MSNRYTILDASRTDLRSPRINEETMSFIRTKFSKNYFGLPPYSMQQSAGGLAYQCRKPLVDVTDYDDTHETSQVMEQRPDTGSRRNLENTVDEKGETNYTAQRKVASALLTMVSNPLMMKHFLYKGGFEAVLKLVKESKDQDVLVSCANCLIQVASHEDNCKYLVEKGIFTAIVVLQDVHDELIRHMTTVILAKLSYVPGLEDLALLNGAISSLQFLLSHVHRTDSLCYLLISLCNFAPAILGNDAELVTRFCFQATKKIDAVRSVQKATFITDVFNNFSRVNHYTSLLVDEGLLPMLLHLIDAHPTEEVLKRATETIANLSINRKNRREIASSGIASRLTLLFEKGNSSTRASALLIMGNLLSSGMFHDKVANVATISNILDNLLDINFPKQFNAVAYCLCQLSKNEVSCEVLVNCSAIPIVLGYIRKAPSDSIDYLWTVLVNITQFDHFFTKVVVESRELIKELHEEVRNNATGAHQQVCIAKIAYSLSKQATFKDYLDSKMIDVFIQTMKCLFSSKLSSNAVQSSALIVLINFANFCVDARMAVLASDLIELLYDVGIEDDRMNVLYVALINIVSNEESCCYKLLDTGVQKFLVSVQDSFNRLAEGGKSAAKKGSKRGNTRASTTINFQDLASTLLNSTSAAAGANSGGLGDEFDPEAEGELGKELTASIIHNLALKRPILAPGVLPMILSLVKNCKTLRVLHCVRAMANMSVHSKSKLVICKESKRLIPMLTVIMRCGCDEAENVQHYCAIILCNILSLTLDKTLLLDLVKSGAVVDLMVVTLLRINAIETKETLGRAFFNLMGRSEIRENLVLQLDILSAILELSKLEYLDLLELCMRAMYNITCDLRAGSGVESTYATKISALKVPSMMISRLVYTPSMSGSVTNRPIRLLLGMAVANMSFNRTLVLELAQTEARLADAMGRVHALGSEESTYCSVVPLYNLSRYPECRVLAGTKALPLIISILACEEPLPPVICVKLCVSTICNFSNMAAFHDQLTNLAIGALVNVIGSPQLHVSIKVDAVQAMYNLVTAHPVSRSAFIMADALASLWKFMKVTGNGKRASQANTDGDSSVGGDSKTNPSVAEGSQESTQINEDYLLTMVGHLLKSLCEDVSDINLLRKMLADGIMNIVLKLAKIEINELKVDMSFCIYFLTRGGENLKVLKRESIDILFWLTLHDTMNIHDLILKNVSRAMRSFSIGPEEATVLIKQDRFFSVLKELIKSKNEDVLWQTAGILYNMMQVDVCLKKLLEKGLIQFIFELASSGFDHVKHVCSACLHMVPESMPNMEDPLALELVLCLLEAQGDKFSEISEKPFDLLPYNLETCYKDSNLVHVWTNFVPSWNPYTCQVDSIFTPALLHSTRPCPAQTAGAGTDPASISWTEKHKKIREKEYDDFNRDVSSPDSSSLPPPNAAGPNVTTSAPPPVEREPPSYFKDSSHGHDRHDHSGGHHHGTGSRGGHGHSSSKISFKDGTGGKLNMSSSLPLIGTPATVPDNTLDAIRKSSKASKSSEVLPSSISFKAAHKKKH